MSKRGVGVSSTPVKKQRSVSRNLTPCRSLHFDEEEVKGSLPVSRTTSPHFKVVKGGFAYEVDQIVAPHTLLLGTQPSDHSLEHKKYFMTNSNAFWHIVGDALGAIRLAPCHLRRLSARVPHRRPIRSCRLHSTAPSARSRARLRGGPGAAHLARLRALGHRCVFDAQRLTRLGHQKRYLRRRALPRGVAANH